MAELDLQATSLLTEHINAQTSSLAESLNQCFDLQLIFQAATASPWITTADIVADQPGVACLFRHHNVVAALVVPESLLLPEWYRSPDKSQQARLDTLAMEWSLNVVPEELEIEYSETRVVDDLALLIKDCAPTPGAMCLRIPVLDIDQSELGWIVFVWPLEKLPTVAASKDLGEPPPPSWTGSTEPGPSTPAAPVLPTMASSHPTQSGGATGNSAAAGQLPPPAPRRGPDPLARLRKLPVTVSVRLSERRISVSQLLAITPGALLTFNKSCDDLLDLYVNNSLYCRGEAVKIGESFGLKVNQIGVTTERPTKIIDG